MSHLSVALKKLTKGRRQQDIADMVGMPRSTVNQYARGSRRVSVEVLEPLLKAFSEPEQRVLVEAYLRDETPTSWFGRIKIDFTHDVKARMGNGVPTREAFKAAMNDQVLFVSDDKALSSALGTLIARARENRDVRQVILDLAAIVQ